MRIIGAINKLKAPHIAEVGEFAVHMDKQKLPKVPKMQNQAK